MIEVDWQTRERVESALHLIDRVFRENAFRVFRDYCHQNNMISTSDLLDFDFQSLLRIKGFGPQKLKLVKVRWLSYLRSLAEGNSDGSVGDNKQCGSGIIGRPNFTAIVRSLSLDYIDRDLVRQAISETLGEEIVQSVLAQGDLRKDRMATIKCIADAASARGGNKDGQLIGEYAWSVMKETLKRISVQHMGEDFPSLIRERDLKESQIADVVHCLRNFVAHSEAANEVIGLLQAASKEVHPANLSLNVTCLKAAGAKNALIGWLKGKGLSLIQDVCKIDRVALGGYTLVEITRLKVVVGLLRNITLDFGEKLRSTLKELSSGDERAYAVLAMRAQGQTLEQVARHYGITRERIRQIEAKMIRRFVGLIARQMDYIVSRADNARLVDSNALYQLFGNYDDAQMVAYCLRNTNFDHLRYFEELDLFLVDLDPDQVRWKLNAIIEQTIPEVWRHNEDRERIEAFLIEEEIPFGFSLFVKYLDAIGFRVYERCICWKGMTKPDIYRYIIANHFPEGIRVYDDTEVQRLRELIAAEIGAIDLPDTDRAIAARITDFCILRDKGTYIIPENVSMPDELLSEMRQYIIDTPRDYILAAEVFERFKERLATCGNIDNEHFLYGVLKYHFEGEFAFFRGAVGKTGSMVGKIHETIKNFMLSRGEPVTKSEIRERFPGISDIRINNAVMLSEDLIYWDTHSYAHVRTLDLPQMIRRKLQSVIERLFEQFDGYTNMNILFGEIRREMPDFVRDNGIRNQMNLYYILEYLFREAYVFNRPHIWRERPDGGITAQDMIMGFVRKQGGMINDGDFKEWMSRHCLSYSTFMMALSQLIDDRLLQLDEDEYIVADDPRFNDVVIKGVTRELEIQMEEKSFLVLRDLDSFDFFPPIQGVSWTQYLLQSIVRKFIKDFRIIDKGFPDRRYVEAAIVRSESPIRNFAGLVEHVVRHVLAEIPNLTVEQLAAHLKKRKMIYKEIPQAAFSTLTLRVDESGLVRLNDWL